MSRNPLPSTIASEIDLLALNAAASLAASTGQPAGPVAAGVGEGVESAAAGAVVAVACGVWFEQPPRAVTTTTRDGRSARRSVAGSVGIPLSWRTPPRATDPV